MISLEIERSIVIVGVSDRMDDCVFVLLSDDVEPPVDVDCRSRFDVIGERLAPIDERRLLVVVRFVDGRTIGTTR